MAELGALASVVGLACAGIALSKRLYQIGSKAAAANHNINRIATSVTLFSCMLKHFATVLESSKSLHSEECLNTADQICRECNYIFEEIGSICHMAQRSTQGGFGDDVTNISNTPRRRFTTAIHKVKAYFEEPKAQRLMAQLEYLKTTLSVLIQTLNLAAVTASARALDQLTETVAEKIKMERLHVETLIMARQLSVIILQQFNTVQTMSGQGNNGDAIAAENGSVRSFTSSDDERRPPRLLTQDSQDSFELIKVGGGNLEFLDRAMMEDQTESHSSSMILPTHDQIIDQLLIRMTRLPQTALSSYKTYGEQPRFEEQGLDDTYEIVSARHSSPDIVLKNQELTPRLELVESPKPLEKDLGRLTFQARDAHKPEPARFQPSDANFLPLTPLSNALGISSPPSRQTPDSPTPSNLANGKTDIRKASSPIGVRNERAIDRSPMLHVPSSPMFGGNVSIPASTLPLARPPLSPGASPRNPSTMDFYTSQRQSSDQKLDNGSRRSRGSPPSSESYASEVEEGDEEQHLGLQIPWRIRAGKQYFDFLDEKMVGPRTPYLPKVSMSWILSHDHAETEISGAWVCAEALKEKRCTYHSFSLSRPGSKQSWDSHQTQGDRDIMWSIVGPLRFHEVEALVERTIDIVKETEKGSSKRASQLGSPYQGQHYQPISPPYVHQQQRSISFPSQRSMQPEWNRQDRGSGERWQGASHAQGPASSGIEANFDQPVNVAGDHGATLPDPPPHGSARPFSPNNGHQQTWDPRSQHAPPSPMRGPGQQDQGWPGYGMQQNTFPTGGRAPQMGNVSPMPQPNSNMPPPPQQFMQQQQMPAYRDSGLDGYRLDPQRTRRDRERDREREYRERERERDRDREQRHDNRDRPVSRGKSDDGRGSRRSTKEKKKEKAKVGGAIAKIAGLAAMLEGLDSL